MVNFISKYYIMARSLVNNFTNMYKGIDATEDKLLLYCILITGFNENNTNVIASALNQFNMRDAEYKELLRYSDWRADEHMSQDLTFNDLPWKIKYLALFCFVYATLNDRAMAKRRNDNIRGLRLSTEIIDVAFGWVYCLMNYMYDGRNPRVLGSKADTHKVSTTNNIILTALTNQYIKNNSQKFQSFRISSIQQQPIAGAASDIMTVASRTLDQLVRQTDIVKTYNVGHTSISGTFWDTFRQQPKSFEDFKIMFYECFFIDIIDELFQPQSTHRVGGIRRKQSKRRKQKY